MLQSLFQSQYLDFNEPPNAADNAPPHTTFKSGAVSQSVSNVKLSRMPRNGLSAAATD